MGIYWSEIWRMWVTLSLLQGSPQTSQPRAGHNVFCAAASAWSHRSLQAKSGPSWAKKPTSTIPVVTPLGKPELCSSNTGVVKARSWSVKSIEGEQRGEKKRVFGTNQRQFLKDSQAGIGAVFHTDKMGMGIFKYKIGKPCLLGFENTCQYDTWKIYCFLKCFNCTPSSAVSTSTLEEHQHFCANFQHGIY